MKTRLNEDAIWARYPEKKPTCLNYAAVREDISTLIEEIKELKIQLISQIQSSELH